MANTGICLAGVKPIERCDEIAGWELRSKAFSSNAPNSGSAPDCHTLVAGTSSPELPVRPLRFESGILRCGRERRRRAFRLLGDVVVGQPVHDGGEKHSELAPDRAPSTTRSVVVRSLRFRRGVRLQVHRQFRHGLAGQGDLDALVRRHRQFDRLVRFGVVRERVRQDPGMRVREVGAHTEDMVAKPGDCPKVGYRERKRGLALHQRGGIAERQQENPQLVGGDQVGQALQRPRAGYPCAGLRQVFLKERLDSLGLGIALGVRPRRADHEVALAVDLPLPVGSVGPRRDGPEDAGEKGSEERAPGGARSSGAKGLSS